MIFLAPFSPKGSRTPRRPPDRRRARRPRVVQARAPPHRRDRPPGAAPGRASASSPGGRAASRSAGAMAPTRSSTTATARSRRCAPATGSRPTCTTCSSRTAARRCCSPTTGSSATRASPAASSTGGSSTTSSRRSTWRRGSSLFEWHSAGQVPVADQPHAARTGPRSWDYFHINSVEEDDDGDLLISARNTCALVQARPRHGRDRLAARRPGRRLQDGAGHALLLPARRPPRGARAHLAVRQRAPGRPSCASSSRALVLGVDEKAKRVRLAAPVRASGRDPRPSARARSRVQPNGNVFVGWGAAPVFSEFSPGGRLLFDGRLTKGKGNYRALRERWTGRPRTRPALAARAHPRRPRPGLGELERGDRGRALAGARGECRAAARGGLEGP